MGVRRCARLQSALVRCRFSFMMAFFAFHSGTQHFSHGFR
jgi:hypothetical protein